MKELASKIMNEKDLKAFLKMTIKDQLIGLGVLAHIAKDVEIRDLCLEALKLNEA